MHLATLAASLRLILTKLSSARRGKGRLGLPRYAAIERKRNYFAVFTGFAAFGMFIVLSKPLPFQSLHVFPVGAEACHLDIVQNLEFDLAHPSLLCCATKTNECRSEL